MCSIRPNCCTWKIASKIWKLKFGIVLRDFENGDGRTDVQTTRAKIVITTCLGRDCGISFWINIHRNRLINITLVIVIINFSMHFSFPSMGVDNKCFILSCMTIAKDLIYVGEKLITYRDQPSYMCSNGFSKIAKKQNILLYCILYGRCRCNRHK